MTIIDLSQCPTCRVWHAPDDLCGCEVLQAQARPELEKREVSEA